MGKFKNRCFLTNNIKECVEHLDELGYTRNPGSAGVVWSLGVITDPTTDSYTLLNSNELVKIFHSPKDKTMNYCKSLEEFKALTSVLDPDYVEPEPVEETPVETEPALEAPAPKKKTTRKKTTKTTETND